MSKGMNSFVNLKKRSVSLPAGCKDLADVLNRPKGKQAETIDPQAIARFVRLILFQAEQDKATELVIGVASESSEMPFRYKVGDVWHDIGPFPSHLRSDVVAELARTAKIKPGEFPSEGLLDVQFGKRRLKWIVRMTNPEAECRLVRVQD